MKRDEHRYTYRSLDGSRSKAEVRTWGDKWVGDADVHPLDVGEHASADEAREALVHRLRLLANVIEREG